MSAIGSRARSRVALAAALAATVGLAGCAPLPVVSTPPVTGRVIEAGTGRPIAGAIVVVRFDASHDELLPDRDVIAHREVISAADGSFALARNFQAGLGGWPLGRTEARVVGVIASGYRCPDARVVPIAGSLAIELAPARDEEERRHSCHSLGARAAEAPRYLAAWQALHPREEALGESSGDRDLDRLLTARSAFGFGENCRGPVADLALSTDGRHVAWLAFVPGGARVEIRSTGQPEDAPAQVSLAEDQAARRLAWTARSDLVLWDPAGESDRASSTSALPPRGAGADVLWRAARSASPPAAPATDRGGPALSPLEPSDLRDEGDVRRLGRSFRVTKALDPDTGLPREILRVSGVGREPRSFELPGEPCGPRGEFGLPQLRIAADGRTAFDLRNGGDGCAAVAIDLDTGTWRRLDTARGGSCSTERSIPSTHLRTAMRGYAMEVEDRLAKAGADASAAYTLRIASDGSTAAISRTVTGDVVRVGVPRFPIRTPLVRIEVGVIGSSGDTGGGAPPVPRMEPL